MVPQGSAFRAGAGVGGSELESGSANVALNYQKQPGRGGNISGNDRHVAVSHGCAGSA